MIRATVKTIKPRPPHDVGAELLHRAELRGGRLRLDPAGLADADTLLALDILTGGRLAEVRRAGRGVVVEVVPASEGGGR